MTGRSAAGTLYGVWAVLMVLLAATVAAAYVNLGPFGVVVALGIAGLKAAIIAAYFMEVRHGSGLVRVVAVASVLWLGILFTLTFADYLTRGYMPSPTDWVR